MKMKPNLLTSMFKLDEKKVIFIHVWSIESEAQEALGTSKQSHEWQGTLPLNSHHQIYSGYYSISFANIMIIINVGQGTPKESPREEVLYRWRPFLKRKVMRAYAQDTWLTFSFSNACQEYLTNKQGMEPALFDVYKQSIALEITSHMPVTGAKASARLLGLYLPLGICHTSLMQSWV